MPNLCSICGGELDFEDVSNDSRSQEIIVYCPFCDKKPELERVELPLEGERRMTTPLDTLKKLRDGYKPPGNSIIVYGNIGTGKTRLLKTCPKPVLLHNFDPGGPHTLKKEIDEGSVIVEDFSDFTTSTAADMYAKWEQSFNAHTKSGLWDHIGTYALDSFTKWQELVLWQVVKRMGGSGDGQPTMRNYMVQQSTICDTLRIMNNLPCLTYVTGHIHLDKDEVTGELLANLFTSPKLITKVLGCFDEVWITHVQSKANKPAEYKILTGIMGRFHARTRLGSEAGLDILENPDVKAIFSKVGRKLEDKPF